MILLLSLLVSSCDTTGINGDTTALLRSRWLKWGAIWLYWSCDTTGISIDITWCHWHWPLHHMIPITSSVKSLHSLGQENWNAGQHDILGHVMPLALALVSCDTDHSINGIIAFLRSWWQKRWNILFWSCDVIGIRTIWHQWHHQWNMTLMSELHTNNDT